MPHDKCLAARAKALENRIRRVQEICTPEAVMDALIASGGKATYAAVALGVDYQTMIQYLLPEHELYMQKRLLDRLGMAENKLDAAAAAGQSWAITFLLERQGSFLGYGRKQEVAHSGKITAETAEKRRQDIEGILTQLRGTAAHTDSAA